MMKKIFTAGLLSMGLLGSAQAQDLGIEITNLTQGIYFTPLLVSAHNNSTQLFKPGDAASANLQAMAEGGDISGLATDLTNAGADTIENPAGGLLAPGASTHTMINSNSGNTHLSLTAMMLPTNDGFVGLNALEIPTIAGRYTYYLNAYDAGTEVNNEIVNGAGTPGELGIPADPGGAAGNSGSGITQNETNTTVHIHRGNLGDTDSQGGASDLDSTVHRWLNPVAKLVITVY